MGDLTRDLRSDDLTALARQEARRMLSAVVHAADDAPVTMPTRQFRKLAGLMDSLSMRLEQCDCAAEGRLGDPRYWVPLKSFEDLRTRYDRINRLIGANAHDLLESHTPVL